MQTWRVSQERLKWLLLAQARALDSNDLVYPALDTPDAARRALSPFLQGSPYGVDTFIDPCSGRPFIPNSKLSGLDLGDIETPWEFIAFYAPAPVHCEASKDFLRLVGYADGHIRFISEASFANEQMAGKVKITSILQ